MEDRRPRYDHFAPGSSLQNQYTDCCCPLSHQLLVDPVVAADGRTYERHWIERHMFDASNGNLISPLDNEPMTTTSLMPNRHAQNLVERFVEAASDSDMADISEDWADEKQRWRDARSELRTAQRTAPATAHAVPAQEAPQTTATNAPVQQASGAPVHAWPVPPSAEGRPIEGRTIEEIFPGGRVLLRIPRPSPHFLRSVEAIIAIVTACYFFTSYCNSTNKGNYWYTLTLLVAFIGAFTEAGLAWSFSGWRPIEKVLVVLVTLTYLSHTTAPIHFFCYYGFPGVVEILPNSAVNLTFAHESTLHVASRRNHTSVVEVLLRRNANVSYALEDGTTPLLASCERQNWRMVQAFLAHGGSDVNLRRPGDTFSPLTTAVYYNDTKVMKLLLADKAIDPNIILGDGTPALVMAIRWNHPETVKLLLEHRKLNVNKATLGNSSPLYLASAFDNERGLQSVKMVLAHKNVDVNMRTRADGHTPIYAAVSNNNVEVVKLLLSHPKINVNLASFKDNSTPIYLACQFGYEALVKLLLAHPKTDVNMARKKEVNGYWPLGVAVSNGFAGIVKLLLKHPAIDANQALADGATALYLASQNNKPEFVKLLLAKDTVDPNKARLSDGVTPLAIAVNHDSQEVVKLLLGHDDIDLNKARPYDGLTPLIDALQSDNYRMVKLLLAHDGCDVNKAKTDNGFTPLFAAAIENNVRMVELLLDHGADPNIVDNNGWSPLRIARHKSYPKVSEMIKTAQSKIQAANAKARAAHRAEVEVRQKKETDAAEAAAAEVAAEAASAAAEAAAAAAEAKKQKELTLLLAAATKVDTRDTTTQSGKANGEHFEVEVEIEEEPEVYSRWWFY